MTWQPVGLGLSRPPKTTVSESPPEDGTRPDTAASRPDRREEPRSNRIETGLPKPLLRGAWLRIRPLVRDPRRAVQAVGKAANRSARLARAAALLGESLAPVGTQIEKMGREWSRAGGRAGRLGKRIARGGRWLRLRAAQLARLGTAAARAADAVAGVTGELLPDRTVRARDGKAIAPAAAGEAAPTPPEERSACAPVRRIVPVPMAQRARTPAPSSVSDAAKASDTDSGRSSGPSKNAASEAPPSAPARPTAPPQPRPSPPTPPARRRPVPRPNAAAEPPDQPGPEPGSTTPTASPRPDPQAPPGLPEDLASTFGPRIRALGRRPRKPVLRALILDLCSFHDWTRPAELARWLGVDRRSLVRRHLGPMTAAGLLERRYPDAPRSPRQAYRTAPAPPPASGPSPRR